MTVVYAELFEFWGIFLNPTSSVPSAVQDIRFQDDGVPSTGVVKLGDVIVCTPVNVCPASVLATVKSASGIVIVLLAVGQENVRS